MVVKPADATFYTNHYEYRKEGPRTYDERAIYRDEALYVLGHAGIDAHAHDRLQILAREDLPVVIAALPERALHYRAGRKGNILLGLGVPLTTSLGMSAFTSFGTFGAGDYLYATATSCLYAIACFIAMMFNDLVFLRQRVRRAYANIEVALKKRFDLLQALVPVMASYVAHERETLEAVASLRSRNPSTELSEGTVRQTNQSLAATNAASASMYTLREDYPHLNADEHVTTLMRTLADVEDEPALMRSGYNDTVEHYTTRITSV